MDEKKVYSLLKSGAKTSKEFLKCLAEEKINITSMCIDDYRLSVISKYVDTKLN